jgi:hypothetical protein
MRMTDLGQFALEDVDSIEEKDYRSAQKPPGVDDTLEQNQTPPSGSKGQNTTSGGVRKGVKGLKLTVFDTSSST